MIDLKVLGSQIRESRLAKNFSMEEIAKQAGITRATLSEIESGNPKCAIGSYLNVMSILGVEVSLGDGVNAKQRKRATRKILKIDKKINHWVVFTIEMYARHLNKPTDFVFKKLVENDLFNYLYEDYEDLHGFSPEYVNDFLDGCMKGDKK